MVAATLRRRRADANSRTKGSADRARLRVSRTGAAATSKLKAAQGVRLGASAAVMAAALLAALILAAALATGGRGALLVDGAERLAADAIDFADAGEGLIAGRFAGLGFRLAEVHLQGASPASQKEILEAAAVTPGVPILGLDLNAIRARVERVAWVDHARVIRLLPDTLVIAVQQRPLMAVWQHGGRFDVVAADGRIDPTVDPRHFAALPRIIGPGANLEAVKLLPTLAQRPVLMSRIKAIRRVDERRWDLLMTGGGTVLLPDTDEAAALDRLVRLDRAAHILDLGLARIDLRNPRFVVVRPGVAPAPASPPASAARTAAAPNKAAALHEASETTGGPAPGAPAEPTGSRD
jgi:cell division protein FtsQ